MSAPDNGSRSRYRSITFNEERLSDLHLVIEPGFIHHRATDARLPDEIRREVDRQIDRLPREPEFRFHRRRRGLGKIAIARRYKSADGEHRPRQKFSPVEKHILAFRERLMASGGLVNLSSARTGGFNVAVIGAGKGRGGTCFGDSGGPVFYGDPSSNLIVAVTLFGTRSCAGVDYSYRTDTTAVVAWILTTIPPSEVSKVRFAAIPN